MLALSPLSAGRAWAQGLARWHRPSLAAGLCLLVVAASACNGNPSGTSPSASATEAYQGANRSPRPEVVGPGRVKQADCDGDGQLNRTEIDAFVYAYKGLGEGYYAPLSGQAFPEIDTDGNYKVSQEELESFISQKATGGWEYYPIDCGKSLGPISR